MRGKKITTRLVFKPRTNKLNSQCVDPAEAPALRRYVAVTKLMRKRGWTEEAAVAYYDRPRGVCARVRLDGSACGRECVGRGRTCQQCYLADHAVATKRYRADRQAEVVRFCKFPKCGAPVRGNLKRKFCDVHRGEKVAAVPRPIGRPKKLPATGMPASWERPNHLKANQIDPKPEPIRHAPPRAKVTIIPPMVPWSRWK